MIDDSNIDIAEVARFDRSAGEWWDVDGGFRALHDLNPLRVDYIERYAPLAHSRVVDVGCGGGLLSEAMAARKAQVVAIDTSVETIAAARRHAQQMGYSIDYRCATAASLGAACSAHFDRVVCLELLEHVPDPARLIDACAALLVPHGKAFFSTINRTLAAWLLAIVGAEYLSSIVPRGTHRYDRFIRPSELAQWARAAGLQLQDMRGIAYNPLTRKAHFSANVAVNYIVCLQRN